MSRERDPGRRRCSGLPSTHLQGRLVLAEAGLGTSRSKSTDLGMQAPSPEGKEGKGDPAGLAASPPPGEREGGGGGSTRHCSSGSHAHPSLHSPSPEDPYSARGRLTPKPEARGVAAPSICQADSGGLSHARTLGPGDPKPPSEVGLMTCLVSDWALSEMLRDKQLQRGQASL